MLGQRRWRGPNIIATLAQCIVFAGTIYVANAGLMLAHRLRRWPNIKPPLV